MVGTMAAVGSGMSMSSSSVVQKDAGKVVCIPTSIPSQSQFVIGKQLLGRFCPFTDLKGEKWAKLGPKIANFKAMARNHLVFYQVVVYKH